MGRTWQVVIDGIEHFVEGDYQPLLNTGAGSVRVDDRVADEWGSNWLGLPRERRFEIAGHPAILRKRGWIFENYDLFVDGALVRHQQSAGPEQRDATVRIPLPPELERLSQFLLESGFRVVRQERFEAFGNLLVELSTPGLAIRFGRDRDFWQIDLRKHRSEWRDVGWWQQQLSPSEGDALTTLDQKAAYVEKHLAELIGGSERQEDSVDRSMKRLPHYPTFWPGDLPFFIQERTTWTKEQTEAWAAWLQRAIEPRTDYLLGFFGIPKTLAPMERFAAAASSAAELCSSDPDAISAERSPSEVIVRGHTLQLQPRALPSGFSLALGIDLGLLMGRLLLETHHDRLSWQIRWKPKNAIDYRNPILVWGTKICVDPYGFGLGLASQLANRELDRTEAEGLYALWDQMIRDGI